MNFDEVFILGIVLIVIFFIIRYLIKNMKSAGKETLDYSDIEEEFFAKIKEGKTQYKLLEIYTPFDLMMIRSLFTSESVPYHIQFEHLMKVYPFVHCENYNNASMYILEEDYSDSIIIIKNYIENKNLNEYKIKSVGRNIFEFLTMTWVIPSPQNYLGIDINYRNIVPNGKKEKMSISEL